MARQHPPVLKQRLVEIRYERGYRYLDRCGDVMLILEDLLAGETGCLWMPGETLPKGAWLTCPELDIKVAINSYHMVVDHEVLGEACGGFDDIVLAVFGAIVGRFGLDKMNRYGLRRVKMLPTALGSEEEAQKMSLRYPPNFDWVDASDYGMVPREAQAEFRMETPGREKGIRLLVKPATKIGVDLKVDERLRRPSHFLPVGQREVLVERHKRAQRQQTDPESGLILDIDYYWAWPPKDGDLREFLAEGSKEADQLEAHFLGERRQ
jgi:hypothetical protein